MTTIDDDEAEQGPTSLDPSPAEIAAACERIRLTWDHATYLERAGLTITRIELLEFVRKTWNNEPLG